MIRILLLLFISQILYAETITQVVAYKVKVETHNKSFKVIAQSYPYQSVNIQAPTTGLIKSIFFESGQKVKKGDLLLTQNSDLLINLQKKQGLSLKKAKEKVKLKKKKKLTQLKDDVQEALIQLENTKILIEQKRIKAPFDGILGLKKIAKGKLLKPEDNIINLADISQIRVRYEIPAAYTKLVKKGDKVWIGEGETKVLANIQYLSYKVDKKSRTITAESIIKNKGSIRIGEYLDIEIILRNPTKKVFIPKTAIAKSNGGSFVYNIKKNKIIKTKVTLGKQNQKNILIISGLTGDENIVALGVKYLKNNQKVKVIEFLKKL